MGAAGVGAAAVAVEDRPAGSDLGAGAVGALSGDAASPPEGVDGGWAVEACGDPAWQKHSDTQAAACKRFASCTQPSKHV